MSKSKFIIAILFFNLFALDVFPQNRLIISPTDIDFKDIFHRIKKIYFFNIDTVDVKIDTIIFNQKKMFLLPDNVKNLSFTISPNNHVTVDCILYGYYYITPQEITDSIIVFANNFSERHKIKVDIEFFEEHEHQGLVKGNVKSNGVGIYRAEINFFLNGTILLDTAITNSNGFFEKSIPAGNYIIGVRKPDYKNIFYNQTTDFFNASRVLVPDSGVINLDFNLIKDSSTSYTIAGIAYDARNHRKIRHGWVIGRKGKHTPTKVSPAKINSSRPDYYFAYINDDGSFKINNIKTPDYYYLQAFSNFYLPSYFNNKQQPVIYWQEADSLFVNTGEANIFIPRDSSFGGGSVSGKINFSMGKDSLTGISNDEIILFAQNVNNNSAYYFSFADDSLNYFLNNLPYGNYRIIGQIPNLPDAYSKQFTISSASTAVSNINITFSVKSSVENSENQPRQFAILQNYPNPFGRGSHSKNQIENIKVILKSPANVTLSIYNVLGQKIDRLFKGHLSKGVRTFQYFPQGLVSGVYFIQLKANNKVRFKKMIYLK